jgi:N-acetylmuramoyl-L-alanine amidase
MLATLAALCVIHAHSPSGALLTFPAPCVGGVASAPATFAPGRSVAGLARVVSTPEARDALSRVAYAEAGNQGDSGLAGVVYTILNRLLDGRWGATIEAVVDAPHQFEPVMKAGGSWRGLRPVSVAQRAHIDAILNLALDGALPDLTSGARYFQNRTIVAQRAAARIVSPSLVGFGGATATARIGAHTFYADAGRGKGKPSHATVGRATAGTTGRVGRDTLRVAGGAIFVGENKGDPVATGLFVAPQ